MTNPALPRCALNTIQDYVDFFESQLIGADFLGNTTVDWMMEQLFPTEDNQFEFTFRLSPTIATNLVRTFAAKWRLRNTSPPYSPHNSERDPIVVPTDKTVAPTVVQAVVQTVVQPPDKPDGLPETQVLALQWLVRGRTLYEPKPGFLGLANNDIIRQLTTQTDFAAGFGEWQSFRQQALAGLSNDASMQLSRPAFDTNAFKNEPFFRINATNSWNATFGHLRVVWLQGYLYRHLNAMYSQESISAQLASLITSSDHPSVWCLRTQQPKTLRRDEDPKKRTRDEPKH